MNYKKCVHPDSEGNPWGVMSAEQLWANVYAIKHNRPEKLLAPMIWQDLFSRAFAAALEFGAETLVFRIRMDYEAELFQKILKEHGFHKTSSRIEYQKSVNELPDEVGTPLSWKTAQELNWTFEQIVHFTKQITEGALDVDPNEKHEDFVQDWLQHDELTSGTSCIGIGFCNERPCALSVAQVNLTTGWSRISYMGLIPEFRNHGLGKWVHRHGFTMMKQQKGQLYHGGTLSHNLAMRNLFKSHGCQIFCEMEEWSYDSKRS